MGNNKITHCAPSDDGHSYFNRLGIQIRKMQSMLCWSGTGTSMPGGPVSMIFNLALKEL